MSDPTQPPRPAATTQYPHAEVQVYTAPSFVPRAFDALLRDATGGEGGAPPFTGGTLTSPLILAGDATTPLGAVTLQQLQAAVAAALAQFTAAQGVKK